MIHIIKKTLLFFLLGANICFARSNLTIKDIQVGVEVNKTRISFLLSRPASLYVETGEDGAIWIRTPEDTFWKVPEQQEVGQGGLMGYKLRKIKGQKACLLQVMPYTRVVGHFLRGNNYALDLLTEEPPLPEPEAEPELEEEAVEEAPEPVLPAPVTIQQTLELPKNEINALTITPKEDGTTWIVVNSDKEEFFDSQIAPSGRKLYLYLPKINWPSLQTEVLTSGNVMSYTVDESNPGASAVVMDLQENTGLVDLLSTPNLDGTYDFVLILANRQATDLEIKNLAEKRIELKGKIGGNKSLSFKFNPPQFFSEAPLSESQEVLNLPVEQGVATNSSVLNQKMPEDSLFDEPSFVEEKQEPSWVSEARSEAQEK